MGQSAETKDAIERSTNSISQEELDEALPFIENYMLKATNTVDSGLLLNEWRRADLSGHANKVWTSRWTGVIKHAIGAGYMVRVGFNRSESKDSHQNIQTKYVHPSKLGVIVGGDNIQARLDDLYARLPGMPGARQVVWDAYQLGCDTTRMLMKEA